MEAEGMIEPSLSLLDQPPKRNQELRQSEMVEGLIITAGFVAKLLLFLHLFRVSS